MNTKLLGSFGEAACAAYLRRRGYQVVGMNYRTRLGEIDLIAEKDSFLAFVEVKMRKSGAFAEPREFVTRRKQARIIAAAQEWLQLHPTDRQPRFDVAEIIAPEGTATVQPEIRYWENAFSLDS